MSFSDSLADMLTRLRNGQTARLSVVTCKYSKSCENVLEVFKKEGYIRGYSIVSVRQNVQAIEVELKYNQGQPVIKEINRISRPGRRIYSPINSLRKFYNGLGVVVLSTSRGVMSDYEARLQGIGGEVLCEIF